MNRDNRKPFRAVLTPHRSLPAEGFIILMAVLIALNLTAGVTFFLLGAWPVVGFMGLDVVLVWVAFRLNYASARRQERIEITAHELILEREIDGQPAARQHFTRGWVQVELEEDRERELIGGLFLRSRGVRTEIGRFLSPQERKSFAATLKAALAKPHI
jgi:uncharacterized membrane protein